VKRRSKCVRLYTGHRTRSTVRSSAPKRLLRPTSAERRGVATGWTGVDTSTPLFPEGDVSGIESLWSVLISFRLHPRPYPRLGRGYPSPHLTHTIHPTLFDLATPLAERNRFFRLFLVCQARAVDFVSFLTATCSLIDFGRYKWLLDQFSDDSHRVDPLETPECALSAVDIVVRRDGVRRG